MTPNSFLETHANDLVNMQIEYSFLRNSKQYPYHLTGDIDILVRQKDLKKIHKYYKELCNNKVRVVQLISKRRDLYVMLFFSQGGTRKYLVLEYFSGLLFKGQVVIPAETLLENCEIEGIWRRLPDRIAITYTFIHYLLYKGFLPEKYQDDLNEYGLDKRVLHAAMAFMADDLLDVDMEELLGKPGFLRDRINQRISRMKLIAHYTSQLLLIRPKSFGCILKVHPMDTEAVINFSDKFHLFRPTHRYVLNKNGVLSIISAWVIFLFGGLAVLTRNDLVRPKSISEYFDNNDRIKGRW